MSYVIINTKTGVSGVFKTEKDGIKPSRRVRNLRESFKANTKKHATNNIPSKKRK